MTEAMIHLHDAFRALFALQLRLAHELTPDQFKRAMAGMARVQRRMLLLEQDCQKMLYQ